jgi:UDP-N-acetylmuramoyl-tripeptide--D-alanyl-D-alanine ligase
MNTIVLVLIALVWLAGTWVRIYRQARFYQIEEYMGRRYLRWWLRERDRLAPGRPITVAAVGALMAFFLSEAPNSPLPGLIGLIAAAMAVLPPDEGEIKRKFRRTPRATRLLGASWAVALLADALITALFSRLNLDQPELQVVGLTAIGLLLYLSAPLILVSANLLTMPVEAYLRRRFIARAKAVMAQVNPIVIGITGSYGKTTTKTFLAEILNARYKAYPTPKSYNTMMGVCLAINNDLANDYSVDYFIVEMGAYIRGEIQRIAALTPPQISIVTEVGPQHLERFGSLENIAIAKYEIIRALPPDGVGVFNWDNPYVREMYERGYPATRIAVSRAIAPDAVPAGGPRLIATDVSETLDGLKFTMIDTQTGDQAAIITPVIGDHNVTNILLAAAVAVHEGLTLADVAFRARMLKPAESRLVRQETAQGITIINDAYSANPAGVISALKVLGMHTTGRRLLITPGMVELGELHEPENRKLGRAAADYATDVILVGAEQTQPVRAGLAEAKFPSDRVRVVDALSEAVAWYQEQLKPGDTVLFLNDLPDTY